MTDVERAAFLRGFDLAQPPGPGEADALETANEFAPAEPGHLRLAVSIPLAHAILAEVEAAPKDLAGATWLGFLRGLVAQAGGEPVHIHHAGAA